MNNLTLSVPVKFDLENLTFTMARELDLESIEKFIILLDQNTEEWELTVNLCRHFSKLYQTYLNDVVEKICPKCGSNVHVVDNDIDGHYVGCNKCEWHDAI